jgi:hypothetical protein
MVIMVKRAFILSFCLAAALVSSLPAQTLYVATGSKGAHGVLYTVNPATAAFTSVGPITTSTGAIGMTGIAFDPLNGILYGITGLESPTSPRNLVTINPATGAAAIVGTLMDATNPGFAVGLSDISFRSDGMLFGISPGTLYTINLGTAAVTSIGATGENPPGGGLAFNPAGVLYSAGSAVGTVDTLNTTTGARMVGPTMTGSPHAGTLGAMNALAFNSASVLYGTDSDRAQNGATTVAVNLVTINTTTGVVTNIGVLPNDVDAIAFGPAVPEPSPVALLGAGAIIAGFLRRRRSGKRKS